MRIRIAASEMLERWDAKHVMANAWLRPASELVPFDDVGSQRIEVNQGSAPYGSVHFDGRITQRADGTVIKGTTYLAHPGDVVFSRIDVRNGAIGVVPNGPSLAFTNEFPIFDVADAGVILPEYAKLLCRSAAFRSQVQALVVGHSGRRRVSVEMFRSMRVPVPGISEQRSIVDTYTARVSSAEAMFAAAPAERAAAVQSITDRLGLRSPDVAPIRGGFVVDSGALDRWSVYAGTAIARGFSDTLEAKFPVVELGDDGVASIQYGVSKSPKNRPGRNGRPYLRVANVQDGYLDLGEIKYINVPDALMPTYRLEADDVLLCEGNSLDLVGRPALWEGQIEECVHQNHVLRVRCNPERLMPRYLLAYMQTAPSRGHFRRRAKKTTNLASINKTDVLELPVAIPPLDVQSDIANLWTHAVGEAQRQLTAARNELELGVQEVERRIVGV